MSSHENAPDNARVIQLRPGHRSGQQDGQRSVLPSAARPAPQTVPPKEPLWRDLVGDVLRGERLAQQRTLKDVADEARISMPYLSEVERGRKEASSEVLAAAARALGLSLAELLGRVHGELVRVTALTSAVSGHAAGHGATRVSALGRGEVRLAA